jgi:uncharacterized delta-60 repeat protein
MLEKFVAPCRAAVERFVHRFVKRFIALLLSGFFISLNVAAAPGDLDVSFGGQGIKGAATIGSTSSNLSAAVAIQADGKILVGGRINNATAEFLLVRYTASGVLDPTFGINGRVTTIVGLSGKVNALAIQSDGKIIAVGTCATVTKNVFCLARFNSDGSLDTSFSGDGKLTASIGSGNDEANAVALQSDGKIVVAGTCVGETNRDFCLARFETDGSFDTTFGTLHSSASGFDTSGNGNGKLILSLNVDNDEAHALLLGNVGGFNTFRIAGICGRGSGGGGIARFCEFALITFPSGSLGSNFSGSALRQHEVGLGAVGVHSMVRTSFGGTVLVGYCAPEGNIQFCLVLSGATGNPVTTAIGTKSDYARAAVIQADDKLVVAGYCENDLQTRTDFCSARYNVDASGVSLDTTFGSGGKVTTQFGGASTRALAVALQSDGRIVAAGVCDGSTGGSLYDLCVARYFATSAHTANCSLNIDGIGGVDATRDSLLHVRSTQGLASANGFNLDIDGDLDFTFRDSLIHARIALGFRGDEVVAGMTFNPNATRTNWNNIRGYYNLFCGATLPP